MLPFLPCRLLALDLLYVASLLTVLDLNLPPKDIVPLWLSMPVHRCSTSGYVVRRRQAHRPDAG